VPFRLSLGNARLAEALFTHTFTSGILGHQRHQIKKQFMTIVAVVAALCFLPCANAGGRRDGLSLQEAIAQTAESALGSLPLWTRVAIVALESESDRLSDFIMDELTNALVGLGIEVADRRNLDLDLVTRELNHSLDGSMSDQSALSIGRMQAAEVVITGQLVDVGAAQRFIMNAIHVEDRGGG